MPENIPERYNVLRTPFIPSPINDVPVGVSTYPVFVAVILLTRLMSFTCFSLNMILPYNTISLSLILAKRSYTFYDAQL